MMIKVKLKKGFVHNGKAYREGDEFEGLEEDIRSLVQQGYCDDPAENATEKSSAEKHVDKSVEGSKSAASDPAKKSR